MKYALCSLAQDGCEMPYGENMCEISFVQARSYTGVDFEITVNESIICIKQGVFLNRKQGYVLTG